MTPNRIAVALVLLVGCLDPEDDVASFAEDFERCGTCDWETSGDVTVVTTVHAGEHAVRLGAGAVMRHALGIQRTLGDGENGWDGNFSDGNWIEYSTDCGGTPRLALEPRPIPGDTGIDVRVRLEGPVRDTFTRRKLMFPALPPFDPLTESIVFTRLVVESGGACRLDNVRVMVSGGTLAY